MSNPNKYLKIMQKNLEDKYSNQCQFEELMVDQLLFNKSSHYSCLFKDRMLFDYIDEFLKRYYYAVESYDRIPKMSKYYTNYLKFFCKPSFREFQVNCILKQYGDNRAELYYIRNYGKGEDLENENVDLTKNKEYAKTLLTTTIKEKINHNSLTQHSILEQMSLRNQNDNSQTSFNFSNFSHLYDESKSVLMTKRSNKDESLMNILFLMDPVKINEQFLVKDKMNHNYKKTASGYQHSNGDRTTKDYSSKINNNNYDPNKIEIKELITIETEREIENGSNSNQPLIINETSSISQNVSPMKYPRYNDFKHLKAPINLLTNGATQLLTENKSNNPRTRNKPILTEKSNEFTITQATGYNIYSTSTNHKITSPVKQNKFLEKIQNETLKALQKIKRTKLEFKNPTNKRNDQHEIKVVYVDTNSNALNGNDLGSHNLHNTHNINNFNIINDLLRFTLSDKNSRNKTKNEVTRTDNKLSIHTTVGRNNINYAENITTSRRDKILTTNDDNLITQGRTILTPNSRSPISRKDNINLNVLKSLVDKTKTLSRNKNPSILGIHSTNLKSRNEKRSKEKDNLGSVFKSFKSNKSLKKDKSVITQSVVNLNIQTPDIEELEKKIFGTFASNQSVMKGLVNNKHIKNDSLKKSTDKELNQQFKIMKTVNNLMNAAHLAPSTQNSIKFSHKLSSCKPSNNNTNTNHSKLTPGCSTNINLNVSNKTKSTYNSNIITNTNPIKKKVPSFDSHIVKNKNGGVFNIYSTTMTLKKQPNK